MQKLFIQSVINEIEDILSNNQILELRAILEKICSFYEIKKKIDSENIFINSDKNKELLRLFLSAKEIEGCSNRTLNYYKDIIAKMLDTIEISIKEITTETLRKYLSEYKNNSNSSTVTIDNIRRVLSSFFAWLEDEDYIIKSPVRRIRKVKAGTTVKEIYTDEIIERMRDNCKEIRDLALIDLLLSTGMRVGELVNLNITDIDFNEKECIVLGKGAKERKVYFDAKTKIHLKQYLKSRKDDNPALFVTLLKPYRRLQISGVEIRLRELGKSLNLAKVHPHKFRRTMATKAIDKGMPIEQVQHLLGHTKIDTTLQYAMVNQNNVKQSHRKFVG